MVNPKVAPEIQLAKFIEHRDDLFDGNKVKPCTDGIFTTLSISLGMTPRAVYSSVVRKVANILNLPSEEPNPHNKKEE